MLLNQNNTIALTLNDHTEFSLQNGLEESTYALAIPTTIELNSKSSLGGSYATKFQIKSLTYKVNVGENGIRDQFYFDQTAGASTSNYETLMTLVENEPAWVGSIFTTDLVKRTYYNTTGDKRYELSNHLGNVLSVVSDKKIPNFTGSSLNYFNADIQSYSDYFPFGMLLPNRHGNSGDYRYVFQYKDHLGNVRLSYSDSDLNGAIDPKSEIIEESNYYPFGLEQKGYNNIVDGGNSLAQAFKYNGVELNESLGINLYEMDFRMYDPAIGRFNGIDPVIHYSMGTSVAFDNNPVFWADPSGADAGFNSSTVGMPSAASGHGGFSEIGGARLSLDITDADGNTTSGFITNSQATNISNKLSGSSPPTDYKLSEKGKVERADPNDNSKLDTEDRILDKNGVPLIDGIAKGILKKGQNFENRMVYIKYGEDGQPNFEDLRSFLVNYTEKIAGVEMAGHLYGNYIAGLVLKVY